MTEVFAKDVGSYDKRPNKVNFGADLLGMLWAELCSVKFIC